MDLEFNVANDAIIDCTFYGKIIQNSSELCLVCMVDEIEDGKQWDRYVLECGHTAHTRCFRNWCGSKNKIN